MGAQGIAGPGIAASVDPGPIGRKLGRPRRFAPGTELELICDAALTVMQQRGDNDVTVNDILAEAGMSTRSFYRHFASKDELLCALYRRDAVRSAARLHAKVTAAPTPMAALEVWIDEILSFGLNQAKAKRVAVLGSALVMKAEGVEAEAARGAAQLVAPLIETLKAGRDDGTFPSTEPERDAEFIRALTWSVAGLGPGRLAPAPAPAARDGLLVFCRRALGAAS